jgi:RNA polymerase sigma-70 factor (ECF subfamily)
LAYDVVPAVDPEDPQLEVTTYRCVEPYPDRLLPGIDEADAEPGEITVAKETVELAFLAAIQHLSPRRRAVLILRDVLGWSAKATGDALDMTEVAVKSALQRARPVLKRHLPERRQEWAPLTDPSIEERVLIQRYMDAHENDDVDALAALLREDVRVSYAPLAIWCESRDVFINASRKYAPPAEYRFVASRANRQPAAAIYLRPPGESEFRLTALEVLRIERGQIVEIVDFHLPDLAEAFGLTETL